MLNEIFPQIEKLLKPHKVEAFELYAEEKQHRRYGAKDGELETSEEALERGVALRVFRDHRSSFVYTTQLDGAGLSQLCESAVEMLALIDPDEACRLVSPEGKISAVDLQDFDESLSEIPTQEKIAQALEVERAARAEHATIRHVRSASYEEEELCFELRNSLGFSGKHRRTHCAVQVMAVAEDQGESESGYDFASSCFFKELNGTTVGQTAARRARQALGGRVPKTQRAPLVFDPLVSVEFLEVIWPAFSGESVYKKRSWLAGHLGKSLFSSLLNIQDDRLLQGGAESAPFDGEGQPGRCLDLVEGGVLKHYLLDHFFAAKLGLPANGSSVRQGLTKVPVPNPSNLAIQAGNLSDEDICREVERGFWISDVIGMHATDLISGDFSVGAQGFEIVNGSLASPVKKMAIAGNLRELLAQLQWVGFRSKTYDRFTAPTLGFRELMVSGS